MATAKNSVANVTTGKPKIGGAVFRAPAGTALPEDATSELDAEFQNLGYISEDGVTNAPSIESEEIKAWGGDTVANPQTGKTDGFQMTMIESLNVGALKAYFGDSNVTGTSLKTGIKIQCNAKELEAAVWVIDMVATGNIPHRIVIPNAKPSELEEITYVDNEATGLGMTLAALPDEEGNTHYEYIGGTAG